MSVFISKRAKKKQGRSYCYQQIRKPLTASRGSNTRTRAKPGEDVLACCGSWRRLGRAPVKQRARGRLGRAPVRQRREGSGAPRPRRCGSAGKAQARSGEDCGDDGRGWVRRALASRRRSTRACGAGDSVRAWREEARVVAWGRRRCWIGSIWWQDEATVWWRQRGRELEKGEGRGL